MEVDSCARFRRVFGVSASPADETMVGVHYDSCADCRAWADPISDECHLDLAEFFRPLLEWRRKRLPRAITN